MVIEQCNPEWASVPLVGFNFYQQISDLTEVTLVTHERNREALEKIPGDHDIVYISESRFLQLYYRFASLLANRGAINWPLYHFLTYPIYSSFNRKVFEQFHRKVINHTFDIVHALTPMLPRYPVRLIKACNSTPFLLGPVNGGVPFPKGFEVTARKENSHLNFIRTLGRFLIPGYRETYVKADRVLVGSTYTLNMLKSLFKLEDRRASLFFENGIPASFFKPVSHAKIKNVTNLLFVGRLVPYKGVDMLIDALWQSESQLKEKVTLTIVGDGPERFNLEQQVSKSGLSDKVIFTGWVDQKETFDYYSQADIFCFPSIREFGGAVVLEAMSCGVPCIVVNNGGIGEYVTEETGFKIEPLSRKHIVQELIYCIKLLTEETSLRLTMSASAIDRAIEFEWGKKAQAILQIYRVLISEKKANSP